MKTATTLVVTRKSSRIRVPVFSGKSKEKIGTIFLRTWSMDGKRVLDRQGGKIDDANV
jgi:hypothetical protein